MLEYDVVIVGGGTAGIVAAIASSRTGARTALVEAKGYVGGAVVEGGTTLHSFFNSYKKFHKKKLQVVRGIPHEMMEYLTQRGACSGYQEVDYGEECDSVCTAIDPELYKILCLELLRKEGVDIYFEATLANAGSKDGLVREIKVTTHSGLLAIRANVFVDCTGYGDLCAFAGASYTVPGDYAVVNSLGVSGIDVDAYYNFFNQFNAVTELAYREDYDHEKQILRVNVSIEKLPETLKRQLEASGISPTITTLRRNAISFFKVRSLEKINVLDPLESANALYQIRIQQLKAIEFLREHIKGCEHCYISRTSPVLNIRRGRCIQCDKELTNKEIISGTHFEDDVLAYGYHDEYWNFSIMEGETYGIPYRALLPVGLSNVYATGMMITPDTHAHMSTRNTVSCMGQGQAAGTAAALCAKNDYKSRELPYQMLRQELVAQGVYFKEEKGE